MIIIGDQRKNKTFVLGLGYVDNDYIKKNDEMVDNMMEDSMMEGNGFRELTIPKTNFKKSKIDQQYVNNLISMIK
jgi:hypothetical protein